MANLIWLGVILGVLASMSGTAGKQLLRFAALNKQKGTKAGLCVSKAAKSLGLLLNVAVGPLIDMGSYAFAPQSIIAPLGGLDVVWNTVTAPCTLGETLTPPLIAGCGFICVGATMTSCFGSHAEKEFTLQGLKDTFIRWEVGLYLVVLLVWLTFNILVLLPRGGQVRGLALAMTAGSIAGNMFCVKAFVEVVQASIVEGTGEYWLDWFPYTLLLGAVFFATSNLYFMTQAMEQYNALFVGAVFEGTLITAACISGCVVFSELDGLPWWKVLLYWVAVMSIVVGIVVVSVTEMRKAAREEEEELCSGKEEEDVDATVPNGLDATVAHNDGTIIDAGRDPSAANGDVEACGLNTAKKRRRQRW